MKQLANQTHGAGDNKNRTERIRANKMKKNLKLIRDQRLNNKARKKIK